MPLCLCIPLTFAANSLLCISLRHGLPCLCCCFVACKLYLCSSSSLLLLRLFSIFRCLVLLVALISFEFFSNIFVSNTQKGKPLLYVGLQRDEQDCLLGHHHLDEFLVVDLAITINIGLADHFINFLVSELLAQVGHDVTELGGRDETVAVLVEHLEGLDDFLLAVSVLHLASHHSKELREIDGAVAISIDLIDHVLELGLSGVLAKGAHDSAQLLGGDGAITVLVEQGEGLLELSDLLFGQLVSHFDWLFC